LTKTTNLRVYYTQYAKPNFFNQGLKEDKSNDFSEIQALNKVDSPGLRSPGSPETALEVHEKIAISQTKFKKEGFNIINRTLKK